VAHIMRSQFYFEFVRWFIGSFICCYILVVAGNWYIDPFFKYKDEVDSISSFKISKPFHEILAKTFLLEYQQPKVFIFGDSRGNTFTPTVMDEYVDSSWYNYSIGGASPDEVLSLVEYVLDQNRSDIEHIYIVMPIRLFVDRRLDRFVDVEGLLENEALYLTNTMVFRASIANAIFSISGIQVKSQKQKGKKEDAWQGWLDHARMKTLDWQTPVVTKRKYADLAARLQREGIDYTFVLPPIHREIQEIYKEEMPDLWQDYLTFYHGFDQTLDCLGSNFNEDESLFSDPYHAGAKYAGMLLQDLTGTEHHICKSAL